MKLSQYLYAFNHIMSKGVKRENVYYCNDLFVWHDMDGYTCYIGYKDLTMTLYFHGKHSYDFQEKSTLNDFGRLIQSLLPERAKSEA